jgi:thiol-disulfide isomerase/thioredoxin
MRFDRRCAVGLLAILSAAVIAQLSGCMRPDVVRAALVASPQEGAAPLLVQFQLGQSRAGGGAGTYYLEFGDGTPLVQGDDFGLAVPHLYASPGEYTAVLTVVGDDGAMDEDALSITVIDGLPSEGSRLGDLAYDFTAPTTSGASVTLSDFRGQVVLMEFWGSWCTPCRESMPHIYDLWGQFHERGLVVLAVSTDDQAADSVQFLQDNGYDELICIWEPGGKSTRLKVLYDVAWIPRSIVVDTQGIVRYNGHPMSLTSSVIEALLPE